MCQAMNGIVGKLIITAHQFWVDWWYILQQEMIKILYDVSTGCKEACDSDDYHRSRQQQTFNMSVTWMRISFDHLQ